MNGSESPLRCARCGATLEDTQRPCWLCQADPQVGSDGMASNPYAAPGVEVMADPSRGFTAPIFLVAMIVIIVGLFMVAPGLGVLSTFVVAPVLLRTYLVVRRREQAGKAVSGWQKVTLLITSFFVAYVILTVVTFSAFGAFCVACLAGIASESEAVMVLAFFVAGAVGLGVAILMGYWVRNRYRRDITRP